MRLQILGSSSSGNCALLCTETTRVLVDAGFSGRRIGQLLEQAGHSIKEIDAVFLTHEHGDHSAGLNGLSRFGHLQIFANRDTAEAVQRGLKRRLQWKVFTTGSSFTFRDLEVATFSLPHDAYDPVGYVFSTGGDDLFNPRRQVAWCTDLGHLPGHVAERVREADVLILEANHDIDLLDNDSARPWAVKQRIKGRHGHLSNAAAAEFLANTRAARWQRVYLVHLSRDCNSVEAVAKALPWQNGTHPPFKIDIVDPGNGMLPPLEL